jgi:nitrate reductase gamma subunit
MIFLAAILVYALGRYAIGLAIPNRYTATALTFTSLTALALYLLGPAAGGRAAGVMLFCAIIDALWKRRSESNEKLN